MQISSNQSKPQTILYIDDDRDILTLAQFALQKIGGFTVKTYSNSADAIEIAKTIPFDLIMLDVMMPDVDGPSLLQALRRNSRLRNTPIVFMTACVQPNEMDKYIALGAAGIIPKPFNPLTLSEEVQSLWQVYHRQQNQNAQDQLDDLRQRYLSNLPAKRQEIQAFVGRRRGVNKPSPQSIQQIKRLAHNLAGSGKSYGYHTISKSAKIMEEMLISMPDSPRLSAVADKLIVAIDAALLPISIST